MAYSKAQIAATVKYITRQCIDSAIDDLIRRQFKSELFDLLYRKTMALPSQKRPKEINVSLLLNLFFQSYKESGISFPELSHIVLQQNGDSIDYENQFVIYSYEAQVVAIDSFEENDLHAMRKSRGQRHVNRVYTEKNHFRRAKESNFISEVEAPEGPMKRQTKKEAFVDAQHILALAKGPAKTLRQNSDKPKQHGNGKPYTPRFSSQSDSKIADLQLQAALLVPMLSRFGLK